MKKMTVGKKIILGFFILILLSILLGGSGVWKMDKVGVVVTDLGKTHLPLAVLGGHLNDTAGRQEIAATLFVIHGDEKYADDFKADNQELDASLEKAKKLIAADPDLVKAGWLALINEIKNAHDEFAKSASELIKVARTNDKTLTAKAADSMTTASDNFDGSLKKFGNINAKEATTIMHDALDQSNSAKMFMVFMTFAILVAGLILAFFITRSITKPISRIIEDLTQSAEQVASGSGQVSSSSQSLAEGASEQAASLEETSSSLEEMSSMTKQNADNSNQADSLMKDTNKIVSNANDSMNKLTQSMEDISKASEETSKIIKTIDEIAFQTNLLALNAAVEAARAGEAGAGFAVVADEVRNLAMRAADAAKNTSNLIEGTVKKIKDGTDIVKTANDAFGDVSKSATKVAQLVGEISAASNEQASGIDQIAKAVAEMDAVVQQNAANAEESASASEEMSAQAAQLKAFVDKLADMIGGTASGATSNANVKRNHNDNMSHYQKSPSGGHQFVHVQKALPIRHERTIVDPNEIIPMD